ncbi:hypothetical protein AAAQ13_06590 [Lactococcus lactis subsp. lactis]|uniref:YobI family P-loop NTPase n=1 Tax=Lactococcus lactis TaxID=1358 RepID=UPI003120423D
MRKNQENNYSDTTQIEEIGFEKLTPNGEIDISNYESALDFALLKSENKDVTNIAMTGLYGSGKSSVLKAYEEKNKNQLIFLNISLAHYTGAKHMKTKNLEGKIVNQLLHQIDYKKIPQTIFKIKDNTSSKISMLYSLNVVFMIALIYGWFNIKHMVHLFESIIDIKWFKLFIDSDWFKVIWFLMLSVITFFLLYKLFKIQIDKMPLKSLKIGGNQIEILERSKESYFDKFMNDVIYLFVNSGADVIVFEDLDRFDDNTIYEKLREINTLANKRRETFKKGIFRKKTFNKLSFLYLIKDDMFKSKDRTKFFDFIIPIVPVMDSSNSYQKFLEVFNRLKIKDDFDEKLLKKLALYIDDYRLLKNIANEYCIYKGRIGSSGITLNKDKLLALIIYKNIFPKDFSALQYGRSYLNIVFDQKYQLIEEQALKIKQGIDDNKKNIQDSRAESLKSIDELDALYLKDIKDYYILVNGKYQNEFSSKTEFVAAIKSNDFKVKKRYIRTDSWGQRLYSDSEYDLSPDFDSLKENQEYLQRLKNINNKSSLNNKKLFAKEVQMKKELEKHRAASIKDLLEHKNNKFFEDLAITETEEENLNFKYLTDSDYFPLLILLIRGEFIDEKYSDYMTYFYKGELSLNDKRFIREILDNKKTDEQYQPDNFEKILLDLTAEEFNRYSIKNIPLTSSILMNRTKYSEYWNVLINDLKENSEIQFIYSVYENLKNETIDFFDAISEKWSDLVIGIINTDELSDDDKLYFVSDYLLSSNFETILTLENLEQLTYYIGHSELLLSETILKNSIIKILPDLRKLGVKFENLYNDNISKEVIQEIARLQIFVFNQKNIEVILKSFDKEIPLAAFKNSNYSTIVELKDEDINDAFFGSRFDQYFISYLGFGDSILKDKFEDIVDVLNSDNLNRDLKLQYINRVAPSPKILSIIKVQEQDLWWDLVRCKIIEITSDNVLQLFKLNNWKVSEELILYINSSSQLIEFNRNELEDDQLGTLFNEVVVDEELNLKQYISILKSLNFVFNDDIPDKIPTSRIEYLITNHIIEFTDQSLKSIRASRNNYLTKFILENFDDYINLIEDEEYFNNDELVELLQTNEFSLDQNKQIINKMHYPLSVKAFDYKDAIKRYIIENNFEIDDLGYLTSKYDTQSKLTSKVIYQRIIKEEYLIKIIDNNLPLAKELLENLLSDTNIRLEYKQHMFANNVSQFSEFEVLNKINSLSLPNQFIDVLKRKKVRINNTEVNLIISTQYKNREWISKLDNNGDVLTLQGRKIIKITDQR